MLYYLNKEHTRLNTFLFHNVKIPVACFTPNTVTSALVGMLFRNPLTYVNTRSRTAAISVAKLSIRQTS